MKFLIDENLPYSFTAIFSRLGHTIHVKDLKRTAGHSISDSIINKISLYKDYVVVTRDDDFVKSHVARKIPDKLIYIYHAGKKKELENLMESHISILIGLLSKADLVEISKKGVRLPLENINPNLK